MCPERIPSLELLKRYATTVSRENSAVSKTRKFNYSILLILQDFIKICKLPFSSCLSFSILDNAKWKTDYLLKLNAFILIMILLLNVYYFLIFLQPLMLPLIGKHMTQLSAASDDKFRFWRIILKRCSCADGSVGGLNANGGREST